MARPGRSATPLVYTRDDRAFAFPVTLTNPASGTAIDLTGSRATGRLRGAGTYRTIRAVITLPTAGKVRVQAGEADLNGLEDLLPFELILTVTDSQGGVLHFVWPLVGEAL